MIEFIARDRARPRRSTRTRLIFEVTETAAIVNIERARAVRARGSRDLGCEFALDDFGAGFGSFYYLKHLPFDFVKIDGDFIKDLPPTPTDQLTVQAIVADRAAASASRPSPSSSATTQTLALLRELRRRLRAGLPHRDAASGARRAAGRARAVGVRTRGAASVRWARTAPGGR